MTWSFLKVSFWRFSRLSTLGKFEVLMVVWRKSIQILCGGKNNNLCAIFRFISQASIDLSEIPLMWKMATIILVPNKSNPASLNDFRPLFKKLLWQWNAQERLLKTKVLEQTEHPLYPLQFAYRCGKGVEDATLAILNLIHKHLEKENSHSRILFIDFSSAVSTRQPH